MSGQSAKKKRLGSRRTATRQKETSEADEFHVTDSDSVAQRHVAEESTESDNVTPKLEESKPETKQPIPMERRKLGSSRKNKGKQRGKDSEMNTCSESREKANAEGDYALEATQTSEAVQLESQEEICQESQRAVSAPLKSSSWSTATHEYDSEVIKAFPTICPEEPMESLNSKDENKLESFQNEGMQEYLEYYGEASQLSSQSVQSCQVGNGEIFEVRQIETVIVTPCDFSFLEEIESNNTESTDVWAKSLHALQGSSLISASLEDSVVLESETSELVTDQSAREITEVKHSLEQPMLSPSKDEVVKNEEQNEHFDFFAVRYAQQSEEVVDSLNAETPDMYRNEYSPQSQTLNPPEDANPNPIMPSISEEKEEEITGGGKHSMSVLSDGSTFSASETSSADVGEEPNETIALLPTKETPSWMTSVETIKKEKDNSDPSQAEEENVGVVWTSGLPTIDLLENSSEDKQEIDKLQSRQLLQDEHSSSISANDEGVDVKEDMSANPGEEKLLEATRHQHSEDASNKVVEICTVPVENQEVAQVFGDDCPTEIKFSDLDNQQVLSVPNTFDAIDREHDLKEKDEDTEIMHTAQGDMLPLHDEMDETGGTESEHMNVDAKQKTHFGSIAPLLECTSQTADRRLIKSDTSEVSDEGLPALHSVSENKEADEETQMSKLSELFPGNDSFMDVDSEYRTSSLTAEIRSDKSDPRKHEAQSSVEQETFSSPEEEIVRNRKLKAAQFSSSEVRETQQSDDVENELQRDLIDATKIQVMHQISNPSPLEDKPLLQTLEMNSYFDSQLQDTSQSVSDEIHKDIKPVGSKRRLGSSRRLKGRVQVREETSESPKITAEAVIQDSDHLKFAEDINKGDSTESMNTEKPSKEDMFSTQTVGSSSASETTDYVSNSEDKSNVDVEENNTKLVEEPLSVKGLLGSDIDYMNLFQTAHVLSWKDESDMHDILSHDDSSSSPLSTQDVVDQKEASQMQNTEALSRDDDSLGHKIHVTETEKICEMAESSMDAQGLEEDKVGRKCEDPTDEVNAAWGIYTSPQLVSVAQVPAVDVSFDRGFSTKAMDACSSSESERSNSGYCETLQVKSKQKKRKMGSTRRIQFSGKQEKAEVQEGATETDTNSDVRNLAEFEAVEQPQICAEASQNENVSPVSSTACEERQETKETPSAHGEEHEQRGSTPDVQSTDSNVIPDVNDLLDLFPQQFASHNVSIVNPVDGDDIIVGEMDVNVTEQPQQLHDFTKEIQIPSDRNRQETENAESTGVTIGSLKLHSETTQVKHSEEQTESAEVTPEQNDDQQHANNEALENTLFNVTTPTNRRRKIGSSRRIFAFQTKGEELHQKQKEDNEATESETPDRDVRVLTVPDFKEQELQLHTEDRDYHPEQKADAIFETVECTYIDESQLNPPDQQTASESQQAETQNQSFVSECSPSTSDTMSELASGGRRRKMGSHRKSRGPQNLKDQSTRAIDAGDERHVSRITEACENTAAEEHREEPLSGDVISEADERQKKPPSFRDPFRPVSEKTSPPPLHADVILNQKSQTQLSLVGNLRGKELQSNGYNVVMIGDSGVGKTSFMKRAQSGKFSLAIPASIGVDSCMWTVVVDGNPVVLHVWDTAGQERFRSITRQVFHRAQAFLLMYDISSSKSFSAISYWASCIQESSVENVIVLLLGNKSDCAERKVTTEQGETLARECNFGFMECSAATGENVIQSLERVARMLSQTSDSRREATMLQTEPEKNKRSTCC